MKHCWNRGIERYSVFIGEQVNAELVAQIQGGDAGFIEKQSLNISAWEIEVDGQKIPVIYDKKRKVIVTCLPKEYMEDKKAIYQEKV